jgi:hypothetical protein
MVEERRCTVSLFVDKTTNQWIVRDPEGQYWMLPSGEDAWEQRQPYQPGEDAELVVVPRHYQYLLKLPF